MNAAILLTHFDRISEAPEAVARLRRFILDLAVRGKLVEQDPNDEPATELLKRIQAEKYRITPRRKGVKNGEKSGQGSFDDLKSLGKIPFALPVNWTWSRLAEITTKTGSGSTPRGGQAVYHARGIPFLRSQNVYNDGLRLTDVAYIDDITHMRMSGTAVESGDLLLNITGGSIGRCCRIPDTPIQANISQHVAIIRLALPRMRDFIHKVVLSPFFQTFVIGEQTGAGRGGLPKNRMDQIPISLPPLAEQHRIVAKVDELMALCDQLEQARSEREARRDRLVAASLHRVGTTEPESLPAAARFHLDHLPRLTTRPEHIKQLRQAILNLAVRGRLAPQNPNDEPAAELLKRIQAEKVRLVKEGSKKETTLPKVNLEQAPFDLPSSWAWARFPELGALGRGKSKHRPRNDSVLFEGGTHLLIQTGDVARSQGVIKSHTGKYNDIGLAQSMKWPAGTLCITIAANIADSGILSFDACFPDSVVGFVPASIFPNARYFEYFMRTAKANLLEFAPATAQKNINLEILNSVLIPLPPLAEQHRIVAKVDELMALCDQLEAQLTATESDSRRLLEAVLRDALAPALEDAA